MRNKLCYLYCFSLFLIILFLSSCSRQDTLVFGVLSDAQGDATGVSDLVDKLAAKDVDFLVFLGDANQYGNAVDDVDEITAVFQALVSAHVPVYIIPGNHENKADYYTALAAVNSSLLIDLSVGGFYDAVDVDFFAVPGYYLPDFPADDGFVYSSFAFSRSVSADPLLLLAHGPPTGFGLDQTLDGAFVGDSSISNLITANNISFGFFGHIHEDGGIAVDCVGERVVAGSWSNCLFLNPGSVVPWQLVSGVENQGSAAVVEFNNGKMRYRLVGR